VIHFRAVLENAKWELGCFKRIEWSKKSKAALRYKNGEFVCVGRMEDMIKGAEEWQ